MAQDLIPLFVFWDLTAIASYYLIGFDRHREESRAPALMALLVTGITAVLLQCGESRGLECDDSDADPRPEAGETRAAAFDYRGVWWVDDQPD